LLLAGTKLTLGSALVGRTVNVAAGSGMAFLSGTLGGLTGAGSVGGISGTSISVVSVGGGDLSSTFDGTIGGGIVAGYTLKQTVGLIKTGTGVFTLTNG